MTLTTTPALEVGHTTGTAGTPPSPAALSVRGLRVAYGHHQRQTEAVHGVDLELPIGQTLALVGQSGSGKSTIAQAVGGLLPPAGLVTAGTIEIAGQAVQDLGRPAWRALRGSGVGYIPQDPLGSLDPLQSVGRQVAQAVRLHTDVRRDAVRERAIELLDHVGIRDPRTKAEARPHELSGGQLQRILIAMAIAGRPRLLIADEPTSALDVTVQMTILDLLGDLQREIGAAILFITHDLALASERSDHLAVLNHGRLVDQGTTDAILRSPGDDYTRQLFADVPSANPNRYGARLDTARGRRTLAGGVGDTPAITVSSLVKHYGPASGRGRGPAAVDGVCFTVQRGTTHALVGESGSGKTTIARVIAGLEPYTSGDVRVGERRLENHPSRANAHARRLQLVYQNPLAALDPKFTIRHSLEEPVRLHADGSAARSRSARLRRVQEVLDRVALPVSVLDRRPRDISGGQRQRVAVARALMLEPEILVLDEPTSALDVTVQSRIIDLLFELREQGDLTYLFISHDLSLVRQIADEVTVLEHGRLVETGPVRDVFEGTTRDYTRRLIDSIPSIRRGTGKVSA